MRARKCRAKLKTTNNSWRVDETYDKVKGEWTYLYRAVDSDANTVEFMLSPTRDGQAAKQFFRKALRARHTVAPRVINVAKNLSYPKLSKSSSRRVRCPESASYGP